MKKVVLNFPTFGFVVGTRALLGAGLGLLLSDRVPADRRRHIALTLIGIGAATTVPALIAVLRGRATAANTLAASHHYWSYNPAPALLISREVAQHDPVDRTPGDGSRSRRFHPFVDHGTRFVAVAAASIGSSVQERPGAQGDPRG